MLKNSGLVKIFSFLLVISMSVKCRRYNVEEEARKLYKEDLKTVLARFRRTPDYLKILKDKAADLQENVNDVMTQILFHYAEKIYARAADILAVGTDKQSAQNPTITNPQTPAFYRAMEREVRRQGDGVDEDKSGVHKLDKYNKLHSPLTVAQRNAMRDLGFEYAGHVIHSIIKNLGTEELPRSTRMPYGGDHGETKTTTEHVSVHTVATAEPLTLLPPDTSPSEQTASSQLSRKDMYRVRHHSTEFKNLRVENLQQL